MRSIRWFTFSHLALALMIAALASCHKGHPLEQKIEAESSSALAIWRSHHTEDFTSDLLRDFDESLRELKYQIMTEGSATGSERINDLALQRIDGLTLRQMLVSGLGAELQRLA